MLRVYVVKKLSRMSVQKNVSTALLKLAKDPVGVKSYASMSGVRLAV